MIALIDKNSIGKSIIYFDGLNLLDHVFKYSILSIVITQIKHPLTDSFEIKKLLVFPFSRCFCSSRPGLLLVN